MIIWRSVDTVWVLCLQVVRCRVTGSFADSGQRAAKVRHKDQHCLFADEALHTKMPWCLFSAARFSWLFTSSSTSGLMPGECIIPDMLSPQEEGSVSPCDRLPHDVWWECVLLVGVRVPEHVCRRRRPLLHLLSVVFSFHLVSLCDHLPTQPAAARPASNRVKVNLVGSCSLGCVFYSSFPLHCFFFFHCHNPSFHSFFFWPTS